MRLRNPDGPALAVHDGRLEGTAVDLAGEPALLADGARLDLAGAELTALEAAVQVEDRSFLVWSVSRITSRRHCRRLHGAVHLKAATLPAETLDPAYARDCGLQLVFTPRSNSAPAAARTAAAPKAAAPPPAAHSQPAP
ncbi:MAG: hypothetical protein KatS3mg121_0235 [Gammaproteobacteria bacterium]|nr:MAG: hypothetical protein KatS3mg121_0235 [Gammaproteobacteria bacterium]